MHFAFLNATQETCMKILIAVFPDSRFYLSMPQRDVKSWFVTSSYSRSKFLSPSLVRNGLDGRGTIVLDIK